MSGSALNCPDKLPYGEVKLDMNTRLALSGPLSV